jgi:hypothetical protein
MSVLNHSNSSRSTVGGEQHTQRVDARMIHRLRAALELLVHPLDRVRRAKCVPALTRHLVVRQQLLQVARLELVEHHLPRRAVVLVALHLEHPASISRRPFEELPARRSDGLDPPVRLEGSRDVDARANVCSPGVMFCQALAGRLPSMGERVADNYPKVMTEPTPVLGAVRSDRSPSSSPWSRASSDAFLETATPTAQS